MTLSCISKQTSIKITQHYVNGNLPMDVGLRRITCPFTNNVKDNGEVVSQHQLLKMACCVGLANLLYYLFRRTACSGHLCQFLEIDFCTRNMCLHASISNFRELANHPNESDL